MGAYTPTKIVIHMYIEELEPGQGYVSVTATVTKIDSHKIKNGSLMTEAIITDKTGSIKAIWFTSSEEMKLEIGKEYVFEGKYTKKYGRLALQRPEFKPKDKYLSDNSYSNSGNTWRSSLFWGFIGGIIGSAICIYIVLTVISFTGRALAKQNYWYCWDVGAPNPHHFVHPVMGDHPCSQKELDQ